MLEPRLFELAFRINVLFQRAETFKNKPNKSDINQIKLSQENNTSIAINHEKC